MTGIHYCDNGCKTGTDRTQTEYPDRICRRCENNLRDWVRTIPDRYAMLPGFINHGTTDRNPDSKSTKAAEAPAPMRLEIIDLLDTRLGRKWQGTETTDDRRGVLGTLLAIATEIHTGRNLTIPLIPAVSSTCDLISRHIMWLVQQDWVADAYTEIKRLDRDLKDACGEYRPKPVGRCHVIPEDTDTACGGPLMASAYGGVRCAKCSATWDANRLRQLGLAQAAAQESA